MQRRCDSHLATRQITHYSNDALFCPLDPYIDHTYIDHNYIDHNCIGHNCIGHNYIGRGCICHNYTGPYLCRHPSLCLPRPTVLSRHAHSASPIQPTARTCAYRRCWYVQAHMRFSRMHAPMHRCKRARMHGCAMRARACTCSAGCIPVLMYVRARPRVPQTALTHAKK
jgi:hypothetical protein